MLGGLSQSMIMTLFFAWIGDKSGSHDWPVGLIRVTEIGFIVAAAACVFVYLKSSWPHKETGRFMLRVLAATATSFALIMPIELAPFFFGVRGEVMLATFALAPFFYLIAGAIAFVALGRRPSETRN
jgi:hypothetical protein